MRHAKISAMIAAGFLALAVSPAIALAAPQQQQQQQSQSAADAAKKAKEQQKTAPKAQTVWTNDSVGSIQGNVNVLGQQSSAASASGAAADSKSGAAAASTEAAAAPAASPQDLAQLQSQLADAKKDLASAKTDLNLAQRKYDLDAAQYYGTPNYAANKQGQATLDGEKSTIATKKQAADAAQKKVDDLTSQIKSLGGKVEEAPAKPASPQSQ